MDNTINHIAQLIDKKIISVTIYNAPKRLTDKNGNRDFFRRVCWEVKYEANNGDEEELKSQWEGFEDSKEAIRDMIKKCRQLKIKRVIHED